MEPVNTRILLYPYQQNRQKGQKVKLVLPAPEKKPELLKVPHKYALPVVKLHCPNRSESEDLLRLHCGNVAGGSELSAEAYHLVELYHD